MNPKRICILCEGHPDGGVRSFYAENASMWHLSTALADLGHQVTICAPDTEPRILSRTLMISGMPPKGSVFDVVIGWSNVIAHQEAFAAAGHGAVIAFISVITREGDERWPANLGWTERALDLGAALCVNSKPCAFEAKRRWPDSSVILAPLAAPHIIPYPAFDPYPWAGVPEEGKRVLLFGSAGLYDPEIWDALLEYPELELCFLGECKPQFSRVKLPWHERFHMIGHRQGAEIWDWIGHADCSFCGCFPQWKRWSKETREDPEVCMAARGRTPFLLAGGCPIVHAAPLTDAWMVEESKLGVVTDPDPASFAAKVAEAAGGSWGRQRGREYIFDGHTWSHRAKTILEAL